MSVATMAKKKSGEDLKLAVTKIEQVILSRAKMLAADRGIAVSTYLSDLLRPGVERDWSKMVRKTDEGSTE